MKKMIIAFAAGALFATAGTAAATTVIDRVTASVRTDYSVELDGQKVALKNAPLAYNGSSYLPVKEISELLGKEVSFDSGVIKIDSIVQDVEEIKIENMILSHVKSEIFSAEQLIKIHKTQLVYYDLSTEEKSEIEQKIADLEQRLAELEARKAELEQ
ncbi:stalk domain-containing protein [Paenibacillus sp. CAU 1782]